MLVARWEAPLFRFVSRLVDRPDDARDVSPGDASQDPRQGRSVQRRCALSTWMYQIALNLCRDQTRSQATWGRLVIFNRRRPTLMAPREHARAGNPPSRARRWHWSLDAAPKRRSPRPAALPQDQREVLLLKEYQGLKFRRSPTSWACLRHSEIPDVRRPGCDANVADGCGIRRSLCVLPQRGTTALGAGACTAEIDGEEAATLTAHLETCADCRENAG